MEHIHLFIHVADAASNTASTTRVVIVNPAPTSSITLRMGHVNVQVLLLEIQPLFQTDNLYTVVDNSTIQGEVNNGNVNLCTTLVTDMNGLFKQSKF